MKAMNKILTFILVALFALVGAQASPVTVEDLSIEENQGDYLALLTLANGPSGDEFTELTIGIDELGTTNQEIVRVPTNTSSQTETFDLMEVLENYDSLKRGETYTLRVSTDDNSEMTKSFLFKQEKDTQGLDVIVEDVEVNSVSLADDDVLQVLNGEEVQVNLQLYAQENVEDARFRIFLEGYEHSTILESTDIFSVREGRTYTKSLSVQLPADMDSQRDYKLRIEGANDLSGLTYKDYDVYVDTQRDRVDILDLVTTPSSGVEPGQNVVSNVRLKNRGQQSQESIKVNVAVPELNVQASSYISNLDFDEVITSDDMLMSIPDNAKAGEYKAEVSLIYNDGYKSTIEEFTFNVLEQKASQEENLLVSFNDEIDLKANEDNTFGIVVGNPNSQSKPVSITSDSNAWADVEIAPSLSMIDGGQDNEFKVLVTPKKDVSGEQTLTLNIKEGSEIVDTIEVSTYVEGSDDTNLLQLLLAALIIIGIIVLIALIVVIARKKNESNEEEVTHDFDSEEYY